MLEKSECPLVKAYKETVQACFVAQNLEELEVFTEEMSKHTKWPWFSGPKCKISGWVDICSIEADGDKSLPFAACKHHDPEANARLIAAAPELLEALKELMDYSGLIEERCDCIATNKARAAIAKATGN